MPKIRSIEKFRGANDKSITEWLSMFEAQCRALETTSDDAFATIMAALNENNAISYEATEKYSGEEYKRRLEVN